MPFFSHRAFSIKRWNIIVFFSTDTGELLVNVMEIAMSSSGFV